MKINKEYDSRIGNLFPSTYMSMDYFFISDWNLNNKNFAINQDLFYKKILNEKKYSVNDYYFINEREQEKIWLEENLNLHTQKWYKGKSLSIFPNGTSAADITLRYLNQKYKLRPLLLAPIYFTYIDILKNLGCEDIHYCSILSQEGKYELSIHNLFNYISEHQINSIIMTCPMFGSGVSINNEHLKLISDFCEENNIILFIDNIYGALGWKEELSIFPYDLMETMNDMTIIINSISKTIFLNGAKTCLLFADKKHIEGIEKLTVFTIGSMSHSQIVTFSYLYNKENSPCILTRMDKIRDYVMQNHNIIKSICALRNIPVTDMDSGIFCLLGIPKYYFDTNISDDDISKIILKKSNILTIPHSRYLLISNIYYWFRVNLSFPQEVLLPEIDKLLNINFN